MSLRAPAIGPPSVHSSAASSPAFPDDPLPLPYRTVRRLLCWLAGLALGLAGAACVPTSSDQSTAEAPTLEVLFAGCEAVRPGPTCSLGPDAELRLWVRGDSPREPEIRGATVLDRRDLDGGLRFVLRPVPGASRIEVDSAGPEPSWTLTLRDEEPVAWLRALEERSLGGEFDSVAAELEERLAGLEGDARPRALRLRARLARARGNPGQARLDFRAALDGFRRRGLLLEARATAAELAYGLFNGDDRFTEAREILDPPEHPDEPAEARWYRAYFLAMLALETGDVRSALQGLERSVLLAERLGLEDLRRSAEQLLGRAYQRVGRSEEAAALDARLLEGIGDSADPCDRAQLLNNIAWSRLLAREAGRTTADPEPLLREALNLFESQPCPEGDERSNVEGNLALAALQRGAADQATAHLESARRHLTATPDWRLRLWWQGIEARIAQASGRPEQALSYYIRLDELGRKLLIDEARWRAASGRAEVFETLGRTEDALAAYGEAEDLVGRQSLAIPIDGGRESFAARHEVATRRYLDLLLRLGRDAEARRIARRSRSRTLRALRWQEGLASLPTQRRDAWYEAIAAYRRVRAESEAAFDDDWQVPADELARRRAARDDRRRQADRALDAAFRVLAVEGEPVIAPPPADGPAPGELELLVHPLPDGAWVAFETTGDAVRALRLGRLDETASPEDLATALLEPMASGLEAAERVRFLPYGFFREIDLHALPFRGRPLLDAVPVAYGLDLGPIPEGAPSEGRRALILADPLSDLEAARREADLVRRALRDARPAWTVRSLEGPAATGSAVRAALPTADLLHLAGHGSFAEGAAWRSAVPLADGGRLTVGDILALERVPRWVVLSGCETGRSSGAGSIENAAGLAQAFLTAGSRGVIAALRPVEDRLAVRLSEELYRQWLKGLPPEEALRRAQLTLRERMPRSDWASFRFLEP